MEFTASKPVDELMKPHPEFNPVQVARLAAYYDGGDDFPIKTELRRKAVELSAEKCAGPMRAAREGAAYYTNYFGDTIGDLVSSICVEPIEIADPEDRPFWSKLAENVNGHFGNATAEARAALTDDFLYNRAWYLVKFPEGKSGATKLQGQIAAGELDARIEALDAKTITSWKLDKTGGVEWARTYEIELIGDNYETEKHCWTYYTADAVWVYEATKPAPDAGGLATKWPEGERAKLNPDESTPHELGVCPVFKVNRKLKAAVGAKLLPTARQLFNEESDASFFKFTTVTGGLFIHTNDGMKWKEGVTLSPFGAVILAIDDKIDRDKPDATTFQALDSACAERRAQLGGLIHNMARQSAQQSASGQNTSRNTGAALEHHADPMNAWLCGFAEAHIACWREMIGAVAAIREDNIDGLEISGLVCADDEDEAPILDAPSAQVFISLPMPVEGKQGIIRRIVKQNADLTEEQMQECETKLAKMTDKDFEPEPEVLAPIGQAQPKPEKKAA